MATELDTNSMLEKVLSYADKPWKVVAILVMATAGFLGYFAYSEKDLLIGAYVESKKLPTVNKDRVDDAFRLIQSKTGAHIVVAFDVNPILGTRTVIKAVDKEGNPQKSFNGVDVGLFTHSASNNRDVVALMSGEIPCNPYPTAQSEIGIWYKDQGVNYLCRVSIPPDPSRFIGQLTVGFAEEPKNIEEVKSVLLISGAMLTKKVSK
jgi:hypothetical protein